MFTPLSYAVEVNGQITENTVWQLTQSPYVVTGNILVRENVVLKIEAGVKVQFTSGPSTSLGYYIRVDGTLDAQGTADNPIEFTSDNPNHYWGCIAFTDTSVDWDDTLATGSILKHCIIEYAGNAQGGLNDFGGAAIRIFAAAPLISDNVIRISVGDGISGSGITTAGHQSPAYFNIKNNIIYLTTVGLHISTAAALIQNNLFFDNQQAIAVTPNGYQVEIVGNTLNNKSATFFGGCLRLDLGLQANPSQIVVSKNDIVHDNPSGNAVAILDTAGGQANDTLTFANNNFEIGDAYAGVFLSGWSVQTETPTVNLADNYWGTSVTSDIDALIYDQKNDFNLPTVVYQPIAQEKIVDSGSTLSAPVAEETENENIISRDTTWRVADSPHKITGNVVIKEGATLTIDPGVVVEFQKGPYSAAGYYIRVDGTLKAQGTEGSLITFTSEDSNLAWSGIVFTDNSTDWNAATSSGSVLKHCILEYAGNASFNSQTYGDAAILTISAAPLISDNIIRNSAGDGIRGSGGQLTFRNNLVYNTSRALVMDTGSALIENNYFIDNQQAIAVTPNGFKMEIKNNTIINRSGEFYGGCLRIDLSYQVNQSEIVVSRNNFNHDNHAGNAIAINQITDNPNYTMTVTNNNFEIGEANAAVILSGWEFGDTPGTLDFSGNFWGTTVTSDIDGLIYDQQEDGNLPTVEYQPLAGVKIAPCGSDLTYPLDPGQIENENIISRDTTWRVADSPHKITGNVIIEEGATLTIEPGVVVEFQKGPNSAVGYYMRVDGTLKAQGTEGNPITFTSENPNLAWSCIVFTNKSTDWNAATSSGSILKHCVIEYAGNASYNNQAFGDAAILTISASPLISDNIIRNSVGDGIHGSGGQLSFSNNLVYNTTRALVMDTGTALIENNYFIDNQQAIAVTPNGFKMEIRNNTIFSRSGEFYGGCLRIDLNYQVDQSEIVVSRNRFNHDNRAGNAIAINRTTANPNYTLTVTNNNFEIGQANAAVMLSGWEFDDTPETFDFSGNYWWTTVKADIDALIYDQQEDGNLPSVDYEPLATAAIDPCGSDVVYPVDTQSVDSANIISQNTTWTLANSPYTITGNVIVKEGYTLTIEPGVVVQFQNGPNPQVGYYIRVDGTLDAQGTDTSPIYFTAVDWDYPWGCIAFTPTSVDWDETALSGSILKHCIIERGGNTQGGLNDYGNALIRIDDASPLISDTIIRDSTVDGIRVLSGSPNIASNQIHNTTVGINMVSGGGVIENNYLINNQQALVYYDTGYHLAVKNNTLICDGSTVFLGNLIQLNLFFHPDGYQIDISDNSFLSQNNAGSAMAILQSDAHVEATINVTHNNFALSEADWLVYLYGWDNEGATRTLNMTDNFWGTTETSAIDKALYDMQDDYRLPAIDYEPIASQEIADIGSSLPYPPMADAGADQTVDEESVVTLDASGSYDPQEMASYHWSQLQGTEVSLMNADTLNPTFVAPSGGEEGATLTFQVAMEIDSGYIDYDRVVVNINPSAQHSQISKSSCFIMSLRSGAPVEGDGILALAIGLLVLGYILKSISYQKNR